MTEPFIDPVAVETILEECLVALNEEVGTRAFTSWEQEFLESLEVQLEERAITEEQWIKLKQIYRERMMRDGIMRDGI